MITQNTRKVTTTRISAIEPISIKGFKKELYCDCGILDNSFHTLLYDIVSKFTPVDKSINLKDVLYNTVSYNEINHLYALDFNGIFNNASNSFFQADFSKPLNFGSNSNYKNYLLSNPSIEPIIKIPDTLIYSYIKENLPSDDIKNLSFNINLLRNCIDKNIRVAFNPTEIKNSCAIASEVIYINLSEIVNTKHPSYENKFSIKILESNPLSTLVDINGIKVLI